MKNKSGITFTEVLQIVFIVLKLLHVINWSWWIVLLPIELATLLAIIICVIYLKLHK